MSSGVAAGSDTSPRAERPRRTLRFTRQGRFYVLVTLGVGAAALNTGNNLLYLVLGLLLSLVIVSGILSDLVLFWVRPSRSLPTRAHAGTPFLVEITLRNEKRWLPSFSIEVEDTAPEAPTDRRCYFLRIEPNGERQAVYRRTAPERGMLAFTQLTLRTSYPFGLFEKTLRFELPDEMIVYPELVPDRAGLSRDVLRDGDPSTNRVGGGPEPLSVRDYRSGDEARLVHARRSASLGALVVRETARPESHRIEIPLADVVARGAPGQEPWRAGFEDAIRRAAWVATEAHARGAEVRVRGKSGRGARALPQAPIEPVLRFLALVEPVHAAEPDRSARGGQ